MRILILTDSDLNDPRAAEVRSCVEHWQAWGHEVAVHEARRPGLGTLRRRHRDRAAEADVVLELVDRAAFLTPLWLRAPSVTLLQRSNGSTTRTRAPLRLLYGRQRFLAFSESSAGELTQLGVSPEQVELLDADPEQRARRALDALEQARAAGPPMLFLPALAQSDSGRAAGMAAAAMATNVIALIFTVVFARVLGEDGYGALIALLAAFLVIAIPGQALQVTVAREVSREVAGHDPSLSGNVRSWARSLLLLALATAPVCVLFRHQLADVIGVDVEWGAATIVPMGILWLLLSIQRGVLQGIGSYRLVGASLIAEGAGRFVYAVLFVVAGLGATGAFLGLTASIATMAALLALPLHNRLAALGAGGMEATRRLSALIRGAFVPLLALALVALLQNVDVIVVNNIATEDEASAYAAVSVAGKAILWVAIGLGLFVLPEAARRVVIGLDGRPVLLRALALVAAVGLPVTAVYAVAGHTVIRVAFGEDLTAASAALPWLALAMTLLATVYLSVQYLLALHRSGFLVLLAIAAVVEPPVLVMIGVDFTAIALAVLAIEALLALCVLGLALRADRQPPLAAGPPAPIESPRGLGGKPRQTAHRTRA